jgi:hypothetical protein
MPDDHLYQRRNLYFDLSARIAQIDNPRLQSMFANSEPLNNWGRREVLDLGPSKVFVKRVPLTTLEYDNMFSTRNLYDLPLYYNYGLGSVGFGVFRELVTHIKTTNWVLDGVIANFPLMYHYRVTPFDGPRAEMDLPRHARYVAYWGGSESIGRYMLDRANANYELLLFLEYIPHTVATWLHDHPSKLPLVMSDMQATVAFLRKHGIIHLDAHFFNMLTDGKRVYLTDFGLALDRQFELTPEEKQFYTKNSYYDYGLLLWNLGAYLVGMYHRLPDADKDLLADRFGIKPELSFDELVPLLLKNLDEIVSGGLMKPNRSYLVTLRKYWSIVTLMADFYSTMRRNDAKDTRFEHAMLRRLLKETGVLEETGKQQ